MASFNKLVAIIGAGPSGLSAGLWLKNLGFEPTILEKKQRAGGMQNLNFLGNTWVVGQPAVTGVQLAQRFVEHSISSGVALQLGVDLFSIQPSLSEGVTLFWRIESEVVSVRYAALVIATGTRYRGEQILQEALGDAVLSRELIACGPYAFQNIEALEGKRVLIVGAGDNAFENARLLLDVGAHVSLVARSLPRAQKQMRELVIGCAGSEVLEYARIVQVRQANHGLIVQIETPKGVLTRAADRLHVLAGYVPNSDLLDHVMSPEWISCVPRDVHGYIQVDSWGRTSAPSIYAVGDVCNPDFPCVVSAIAQGAKAAKAIELDLRGDASAFANS